MKTFKIKPGTLSRAALLVAIPASIIAVLWGTRSNTVTLTQVFLSFILIWFPWQAYMTWRRSGRNELPLFGMISAMYAVYYAVPMFWGDLSISSDYGPSYALPTDAITQAMLMAAGGVAVLWLGMKSRLGQKHIPRLAGKVTLLPTRLNYVRFVLVAGSLLSFSDLSTYALGAGGRQAVVLLLSTIPLLAFAVLFRRLLQGDATLLDRLLIAGFLLGRFFAGMASGWLGVFTSILVICASLYVAERKRIPRFSLLIVVAFTLFFQVGKDDFRRNYWVEQNPAGKVERLSFWVETSFEKWNDALTNPSADTLRETMSPSVNRLSLLNQTANVIDKTPTVVPYQHGQLYSYMFITLIPRFVWPDKPSVNDANQYYQVAYGLTSEENLGGVSIAVGVLTEGFMNFGWIGALGVMFLLGIFFDFYQTTFLSKDSGILLSALGVVLLPQFLSIESQMAQYLGGIVQQVVFTLIVMAPALQFGRKRKLQVPSHLQYAQK